MQLQQHFFFFFFLMQQKKKIKIGMGPLKSMGPRASAHRVHGLRWPCIYSDICISLTEFIICTPNIGTFSDKNSSLGRIQRIFFSWSCSKFLMFCSISYRSLLGGCKWKGKRHLHSTFIHVSSVTNTGQWLEGTSPDMYCSQHCINFSDLTGTGYHSVMCYYYSHSSFGAGNKMVCFRALTLIWFFYWRVGIRTDYFSSQQSRMVNINYGAYAWFHFQSKIMN